jgi:uncharacterized protein (TIGR02284 family)
MNRLSHELGVLNELLEVTLDSVAGYREAAARIPDSSLKFKFLRRANERQRVFERLSAVVWNLGGEPPASGTALGSAHRAFLNMRSRLSSDKSAVVSEVARGEEFLRSCFEDVLQDNVLSPRAHDAVRTAYGSVWTGEHAVNHAAAEFGVRPQVM